MKLLAWLLVKHFIVDFPLQTRYQYANKGKYLHPGGILHAILHGLSTYLLFYVFDPGSSAAIAGLVDYWCHYHIDWLKVNICRKFNWSRYTDKSLEIYSNNYFQAIGIDQLLHHMTYVMLVYSYGS